MASDDVTCQASGCSNPSAAALVTAYRGQQLRFWICGPHDRQQSPSGPMRIDAGPDGRPILVLPQVPQG